MPYCNNCGNTESLASSKFSPSAETANSAPYGLLANFDNHGCVITMECQGASLDDAQQAYEQPEKYFNLCPVCGSQDIHW